MAEEINMVPGIAEEQTVNEVEVVQHGKMEFRLIDPTEAGFLKHIEWGGLWRLPCALWFNMELS